MNEARLRELLREAPIPQAAEAERRGLALAVAAFREREAAAPAPRRRTSPRRLALALVVALLAAGLLLSLASASVRHWVGDVFSGEVPRARPGLAATPGGGRLLVSSQAGPWVVQADGSRRLLGEYREASWSPHGLYVAAVAGRTLTAVEPDGTPHWSLSAEAPVTDPRWSPAAYPYRIAYRSGRQLRVVDANGSRDRLIARGTAAVAPAWSPAGPMQVAFVGGHGLLHIADAESGASLSATPAMSGVVSLEWGDRGRLLLEATRGALRLRPLRIGKIGAGLAVEPGQRLPLPPGARVEAAALSPHEGIVAAVVRTGRGRSERSSVFVYRGVGPGHRVLTVPGRLSQALFSPSGRRLLVTWPEADEWLFLPLGRGRPEAVSDVAAAFAPGQHTAAFPSVDGWCCSAR